MIDERRDTVVVENDRGRSPLGWIVGVIVVVILLILFFMYGGFGLFGGGSSNGGSTTNNTVNVPASGSGSGQ